MEGGAPIRVLLVHQNVHGALAATEGSLLACCWKEGRKGRVEKTTQMNDSAPSHQSAQPPQYSLPFSLPPSLLTPRRGAPVLLRLLLPLLGSGGSSGLLLVRLGKDPIHQPSLEGEGGREGGREVRTWKGTMMTIIERGEEAKGDIFRGKRGSE